MTSNIPQKIDPVHVRTQLALFFVVTACLALGTGVYDSTFNNYLKDTFSLSAQARGFLELPRETPGFLVVLMTGLLCMLPVTRLGMVGALTLATGMFGLAFSGSHYYVMVVMMVLGSTGLHLMMPVSDSLCIGLSGENNRGKRMGQIGAVSTAGTIAGTGLVWRFMDKTNPQYKQAFIIAGCIVLIGAVLYGFMHIPHLHQRRARLVVARKFTLYYFLEFLYGARKQIFITFGPWVLIEVYGKPAKSIAGLLMIAAIIGIGFRPLVGTLIDRLGERTVMVADGLLLFGVCLGYGYALRLFGTAERALPVASACFILDNLLFALSSSRAIYMSRLASTPQEVTSTLAMGISVNHIASMTIPLVAGTIWNRFGFERVFLAAAILALTVAIVSTFARRKTVTPGTLRLEN